MPEAGILFEFSVTAQSQAYIIELEYCIVCSGAGFAVMLSTPLVLSTVSSGCLDGLMADCVAGNPGRKLAVALG